MRSHLLRAGGGVVALSSVHLIDPEALELATCITAHTCWLTARDRYTSVVLVDVFHTASNPCTQYPVHFPRHSRLHNDRDCDAVGELPVHTRGFSCACPAPGQNMDFTPPLAFLRFQHPTE